VWLVFSFHRFNILWIWSRDGSHLFTTTVNSVNLVQNYKSYLQWDNEGKRYLIWKNCQNHLDFISQYYFWVAVIEVTMLKLPEIAQDDKKTTYFHLTILLSCLGSFQHSKPKCSKTKFFFMVKKLLWNCWKQILPLALT
jgi:hypothetical protein